MPACASLLLVSKQYHEANNMTDALAALSAAVAAQLPCRDALMQEYDDKWHQDGLVMDKWFILQATSPAANVLETVRGLLQHRSFTMSNPNRIRSLIGAFAGSNTASITNCYYLAAKAPGVAQNTASAPIALEQRTTGEMQDDLFAYQVGMQCDTGRNGGFPVLAWQGGRTPDVPSHQQDIAADRDALTLKDAARAEEALQIRARHGHAARGLV